MKFARQACCLLGIFTLGAAFAGEPLSWTKDTVDPAIGNMFTSLRLDRYGNAHLIYFQSSTQQLRYSFWDHAVHKWFTSDIDTTSGFCSLALDSNQFPHISYLGYGTGKIKYASWNGSSWKKEVVQIAAKEISYYTSIALDPNDYPIISFYEYFNANGDNALRMRAVKWNGSYWEVETIDSTPGSGKFNAVAIDATGRPQLAYANVTYGTSGLRYAVWDGKAWKPQIVEGNGEHEVFSVALVTDKRNTPHITYTDVSQRLIKYAVLTDKGWKTEAVDTVSRVAYPDRNGIALDDAGNPYISYYDEGSGMLKLANKVDTRWLTEVVDVGPTGYTSSLQIHNGQVWVSYAGSTGLKIAHRKLPENGPRLAGPSVSGEGLANEAHSK